VKKMMNLQRLEEVRSNLNNLASLASIIGPHTDLVNEVQIKLAEFGVFRISMFGANEPEPVKEPDPLPAPIPINRKEIRSQVARVKEPKPADLPPAPGSSRRVASSTCYNQERYVPYKVLWAKVIIRAAYDYALWKDSKEMRLRKFAQDAERWLFEPSDRNLGFENICFIYDFPIDRIRQKTRALTKQDVKKLEFRERHGRAEIIGLAGGNDE
jgi:hypothetical protein